MAAIFAVLLAALSRWGPGMHVRKLFIKPGAFHGTKENPTTMTNHIKMENYNFFSKLLLGCSSDITLFGALRLPTWPGGRHHPQWRGGGIAHRKDDSASSTSDLLQQPRRTRPCQSGHAVGGFHTAAHGNPGGWLDGLDGAAMTKKKAEKNQPVCQSVNFNLYLAKLQSKASQSALYNQMKSQS